MSEMCRLDGEDLGVALGVMTFLSFAAISRPRSSGRAKDWLPPSPVGVRVLSVPPSKMGWIRNFPVPASSSIHACAWTMISFKTFFSALPSLTMFMAFQLVIISRTREEKVVSLITR